MPYRNLIFILFFDIINYTIRTGLIYYKRTYDLKLEDLQLDRLEGIISGI